MAGSQGLGLSRINFPFMLGTMFTPNRDRAKLIGFGVHFLNGWIFASVYAAAFESWRRATWCNRVTTRPRVLSKNVRSQRVLTSALPIGLCRYCSRNTEFIQIYQINT